MGNRGEECSYTEFVRDEDGMWVPIVGERVEEGLGLGKGDNKSEGCRPGHGKSGRKPKKRGGASNGYQR